MTRHAPATPSARPHCPIPSLHDVEARMFLDVRAERPVESSWGVLTREAQIYECPVSGLRFRLPAPADAIEEFYEAQYHERMTGAKENDAARRAAYEAENRERIRFLQRFCQRGRVLDIGCSAGLFASQLRDAGFDAMGADISEFACQETAKVLGVDRVFHGAVEDLAPKLAASLDAVTMMDVIEHFPDVVSPLEAIREMLRPGGVLFLRTPTLSSPFYRVAEWTHQLSGGRFQDHILKIYHAEHFYFFTEDAMRRLLADTGYEILAIDADPLLWRNFRSAELREGPVTNLALATVYFLGRMVGRGHGMRVVARRPH